MSGNVTRKTTNLATDLASGFITELDEQSQRVFFDTNIVVYCFDSTEPRKQTRAKDLLAQALNARTGVVSYQVVQEFCNVASKNQRLNLPHERILAYVNLVLQPMNQVASSHELLTAALAVRRSNGFSFYDSLIIAAAHAAKCQVLYSEDMQHLQRIGDLQVVNPFLVVANENTPKAPVLE
jgi:predicted nucleic acid-binding protein